jgi:putative transferase (TIGR04331 family)
MGKLYLNTVDDRFDPETDRLIGPWCLIGSRWIDEEWSRFDFIEPFENSEEEGRAANACAELIRFHLTRLSNELNALHDETRCFPFWWTLLTPWLQHLVEASWRHWVHIERFVERHRLKTLSYDTPANMENIDFEFADTRDFIYRGLRSRDVLSWMMAGFLSDLAPDHWERRPIPAQTFAGKNTETITPPTQSNAMKRLARRFLGRLPVTNVPGISVSSIPLSLYVNLLPRKTGEEDFRGQPAEVAAVGFPPAYLRWLERLIHQTIPRSFTKEFRAYDSSAANTRYHRGRLFVTAPTIFEDRQSFEIAHALTAGERVVRTQHGSEYGIVDAFNIGWMNEYVNAAFLTWGWPGHKDFPGRFIPVSAPMLAGLKGRYKPRSRKIVLVGTSAVLVPFRIASAQRPSAMSDYRSDKALFINTLDAGIQRDLIYRPYKRGHSDLPDQEWLAEHVGSLAIHSGPLSPLLLGSRLTVLDHPGTTLHVAMAANIPTVCFWRHGLFAPSAEQKPVFDLLKSAGILHDAPESAAAHVNRIAADVGAWWYNEKTQQARRIWSEQHARTDRIWWWSWLTALARI